MSSQRELEKLLDQIYQQGGNPEYTIHWLPNGDVLEINWVTQRANYIGGSMSEDWAAERKDVLDRFLAELTRVTGDGSKKRQAGTKPPWYRDKGHEGAIFSHLMKWKRGEKVDPDSGAHPLVHAAWRCLAIACSESGNNPDADQVRKLLEP